MVRAEGSKGLRSLEFQGLPEIFRFGRRGSSGFGSPRLFTFCLLTCSTTADKTATERVQPLIFTLN